MNSYWAAREHQFIGIQILFSIISRFALVVIVSLLLIKLVSVVIAQSTELHTLELLSAAQSYLDKDKEDGGPSGGQHR